MLYYDNLLNQEKRPAVLAKQMRYFPMIDPHSIEHPQKKGKH